MNRDWGCDLPQDVLGLVLSKFMLMNDVKRFGAVCKQWSLAAADYAEVRVGFGTQWLVKKKLMGSGLTLFNPLVANPTSIDIPHCDMMRGALILCSKHGWLLMNRGRKVFFLEPLSKSIIKLPNLRHCGTSFSGFTITSSPASKHWQICGLKVYEVSEMPPKRKFGIFTLSVGDEDWTRTLGTVPRGYFEAHDSNPVYHKGKFYFVCGYFEKLLLGVLDPGTRSWKLLAPEVEDKSSFHNHYLLDFDGDLVAVSILRWRCARVRKWDESRMIWDDVNDIGEYTFFLNEKTSYAKKSTRGYMSNKLFFPDLHGKYGVFYCFQNGAFQTFDNNFISENPLITLSILHSCWMEPITEHDLSRSSDHCTTSDDEDEDEDDGTEEDEEDGVDYRTEDEDQECLNILKIYDVDEDDNEEEGYDEEED